MKYYECLEPSTSCELRPKTVSWTFRMEEIPKSYYEKPYTQGDSVVRTKKWIINNFKTEVKHESVRSY